MADTYEAFYNGKPLNPNRGLPTMSYAQAEDCGLTESERLWCRTDGEDTPITADDIPYDSNNSVKDKIDEVDGKTDNTVKTLQGYAPNDLNNCVNGKVYWVNNSGGNVQHAPSQNAFHIFTFLTIPNYGFQMAIQYTSNQIYLRTLIEGSWGTWKSVNLS